MSQVNFAVVSSIASEAGSGREVVNNASVRVSLEIINQLADSICVGFRSGQRFGVARDFHSTRPVLIVREITEYVESVKVDTSSLSNDVTLAPSFKTSQVHLAEMQRLDTPSWTPGMGKANRYVVQHEFYPSDFEQHGGQFYIRNLDLMIGMVDVGDLKSHPGTLQGSLPERKPHDKLEMFYRLEINDPQLTFGRRFCNIDGQVLSVPVVSDPTRLAGVYRTLSVNNNHNSATLPRTTYHSFEEADKELSLYHSHEEARTMGDPAGQRKREYEEQLAQLRVEEQRLKNEFRERDEKAKRDQFELNQELERIRTIRTIQEDRLRTEALITRDRIERHTNNRKEWGEAIKYAPLVIAGIGAAYAAWKKFSEEK